MTILFLCRLFYPHIGGVEKHVMEISKILIKKGHKVMIIIEDHENSSGLQTVREFEIEGIPVYATAVGDDDGYKKFRIWKSLWQLRKIIGDAEIVHCHDVFFWYLPFRFLFPFKKVFTTFHGYESYPITKKAIIVRKISEKLSMGNICIGDFIKKWYGTKPDFISYGGVEIKNQNLTNKDRKYNNESAIFIGRLDNQTGISTYNKAFEIIKTKYPNFEFLVVGDGPSKKLLSRKIKQIGFQENPEKYFDGYHFAFVSRYLSILEAMALRRLIFAVYDNPVKEDYLRMSPFAEYIIIENNPERLAEKVIYYLNKPEMEKKKIDAAFNYVKKQTWEEVVNIYLRLWKI